MKQIVRIFLLSILICLSVYACVFAQNNATAKGYYSYNVSDTATVQATRTTLQTAYGNTGLIYFDKTRNKWRGWDGTQYSDLFGSGGGGDFWPLSGTAAFTGSVQINGGAHAWDITADGVDITSTADLDMIASNSFSVSVNSGAGSAVNVNSTGILLQSVEGVQIFSTDGVGGSGNMTISTGPGGGGNMDINSDGLTIIGDQIGMQATSGFVYTGIGTDQFLVGDGFGNPNLIELNSDGALTIAGAASGAASTTISAGGSNSLSLNASSTLNTFVGKTVFTPNATIAGLNVGSFAGTPSTRLNGDWWYNATSSAMMHQANGNARFTLGDVSPLNNSIPFYSGSDGRVENENAFQYNPASNALTITSGQIDVSSGAAISTILGNRIDIGETGANETQVSAGGVNFSGITTTTFQINGGQPITVNKAGQLYGSALHNNGSAVTGTTNQYIASGTYTPTITNTTNVSASTPYACQWMRVGNVVTVSGRFDADAVTTAIATAITMTLPIASNVNATTHLGGTFQKTVNLTTIVGAGILGGGIDADIGLEEAFFSWAPTSVTNDSYTFSYTYVVL